MLNMNANKKSSVLCYTVFDNLLKSIYIYMMMIIIIKLSNYCQLKMKIYMHFVNIFLINDENYINFLGTFACFCPACKM